MLRLSCVPYWMTVISPNSKSNRAITIHSSISDSRLLAQCVEHNSIVRVRGLLSVQGQVYREKTGIGDDKSKLEERRFLSADLR